MAGTCLGRGQKPGQGQQQDGLIFQTRGDIISTANFPLKEKRGQVWCGRTVLSLVGKECDGGLCYNKLGPVGGRICGWGNAGAEGTET